MAAPARLRDYSTGRIYMIVNDVNPLVYVGSTIRPLSERMAEHRKRVKSDPLKIYAAMAETGVEHFRIELIEDFPCERLEQLLAREGQWIRTKDSIAKGYNQILSGRTKKEYYVDNKEIVLEKRKEYVEANKESVVEKKKEWVAANKDHVAAKMKKWREDNKARLSAKQICTCGREVTNRYMKEHLKSKVHLNN